MYKRITFIVLCLVISGLMTGCAANRQASSTMTIPVPLTAVHQIDSFKPEVACTQALEVVNNNPYEQEFFEKVFARIVEQCMNSRAPENADIIWERFVKPLNKTGKVPPDLAKMTWNYYFAKQFASLPGTAPVGHYCNQLGDIKKNLEKEYEMKKAGFDVCKQGNPDVHFLNAMYVYNTLWAACHEAE